MGPSLEPTMEPIYVPTSEPTNVYTTNTPIEDIISVGTTEITTPSTITTSWDSGVSSDAKVQQTGNRSLTVIVAAMIIIIIMSAFVLICVHINCRKMAKSEKKFVQRQINGMENQDMKQSPDIINIQVKHTSHVAQQDTMTSIALSQLNHELVHHSISHQLLPQMSMSPNVMAKRTTDGDSDDSESFTDRHVTTTSALELPVCHNDARSEFEESLSSEHDFDSFVDTQTSSNVNGIVRPVTNSRTLV